MNYLDYPVKTPYPKSSFDFSDRVYRMAPQAPVGFGRLLFRYAEDAGLAPDVIAVLAFKETGRFRYGGTEVGFSADASFNNFGGIKNTAGTATQRFLTVSLGVRALVAHVFWYASKEHVNSICGVRGIGSNASEFDPRHFTWGHTGKLIAVKDFGGGVWNTSANYGATMVPLLEEFWS